MKKLRTRTDRVPSLMRESGNQRVQKFLKRAIDASVAATVLLACLPALAFVAGWIFLKMGRPIFFRQRRPGLHGRPFTLYKFRTMTNARDASGRLLPDGERLTRLGRFLRQTSLDELPQLWNVLRGDMSLVGPRPLLMEYLDEYTPEQSRRHDVVPGITGWAQIHGRNAIAWEEKFALDLWYVSHWSIRLDLRILIATVFYVLRCKSVSSPEHATMPRFLGARSMGGGLHPARRKAA